MSATDHTLATVTVFDEASNRHDVEAVMKLMTDDVVFENTSGGRFEGRQAVRGVLTRAFELMSTGWFETEGRASHPQLVAVRTALGTTDRPPYIPASQIAPGGPGLRPWSGSPPACLSPGTRRGSGRRGARTIGRRRPNPRRRQRPAERIGSARTQPTGAQSCSPVEVNGFGYRPRPSWSAVSSSSRGPEGCPPRSSLPVRGRTLLQQFLEPPQVRFDLGGIGGEGLVGHAG